MKDQLWTSAAACTLALLLSLVSVRAGSEPAPFAQAFPSLPLPPDIVGLIELSEADAVSVASDPRELERQIRMPEVPFEMVHLDSAHHHALRGPAGEEQPPEAATFPSLPLPPEIGALVGFATTYAKGRNVHLARLRRASERHGLPPDVADAVAQIESSYDPNAIGNLGEVGLMQIRPATASLLGYTGAVSGLFEPDTNVYYSVAYLAGAWRRANGDLCRALMKYRAGHGEERMSAPSVEYCRRARSYLASIGSPLGEASIPPIASPDGAFAAKPASEAQKARQVAAAGISGFKVPLPPRRPEPENTKVASAGQKARLAAQANTSTQIALGKGAGLSLARPSGPYAATPATSAERARQVASAGISALNAPLSPRRPESKYTRVASAGQMVLATVQTKASTRVPLGEGAGQGPARSNSWFAARPLSEAQQARQVATAGRSALGAPLPPRRPERDNTRIASGGIALSAAQTSASNRAPRGEGSSPSIGARSNGRFAARPLSEAQQPRKVATGTSAFSAPPPPPRRSPIGQAQMNSRSSRPTAR